MYHIVFLKNNMLIQQQQQQQPNLITLSGSLTWINFCHNVLSRTILLSKSLISRSFLITSLKKQYVDPFNIKTKGVYNFNNKSYRTKISFKSLISTCQYMLETFTYFFQKFTCFYVGKRVKY